MLNIGSEDMPKITEDEARKSLLDMKINKAPGDDDTVVEAVKKGGEKLLKAVTRLCSISLINATTLTA